jgi:glycosyltransferase involved in cell wall biosynthesis
MRLGVGLHKRKTIGVVSHFAYGAVAGGIQGHIGGVERQTSMLCRWLSDQGYGVSIITWDEGQQDDCIINGVRVIKLCRQDAGIRGVRFIYPRWTSLNRALQKANADIYYHNCGEYVTGQVALWCAAHQRRFVYSVASDPDCDPALPKMRGLREKLLYRYGLRRASVILVQTAKQKAMLKAGFDLSSAMLPMPCEGPTDAEYSPPIPRGPADFTVLWVGRIARVKQLELLIEVAASLPGIRFEVVGGPDSDGEYAEYVLGQAHRLSNVMLHGRVARERMPELYRRASLLCCTSIYEGFPNTFLEAWSYGVPVLSTVDPDNLIQRLGLGLVGTNRDTLVAAVRRMCSFNELWRSCSAHARAYYCANHTLERAMPLLEGAIMGNGATG